MKTAGVFLTRKCNMNCSYCNVPNFKTAELSVDEWKDAIDIMVGLGVKKINFLGGEPTIYRGFLDLISYLIDSYDLELSFTTNGTNYNICKELIQKYKKKVGIGVSIDNLDLSKSISPTKVKKELEFIEKLENEGLLKDAKLTCYIVLNKTNLNSIVAQIKMLGEKGIRSYILPYHWDVNNDFVHRKSEHLNAFDSEESYNDLKITLEQLRQIKDEFDYIVNSRSFFDEIEKHIMKLDRHCNGLHELRVNCDGRLMCCCDKNGKVNQYFNIFDLKDSEKLNDFLIMREEDTVGCSGCLWPSVYESELRDKNG